jgi:hypothetical protein
MAIRSAKGTLFKTGDGASPEVYSTVAQMRSISGPSTTGVKQDITTHSTAGNWMESAVMLLDPGTVGFPANYDSAEATHAFSTGVWSDFTSLTLMHAVIDFPLTIGYLHFSCYCMGHAFDAPVDNILGVNFEFAITGAITAANGASPY